MAVEKPKLEEFLRSTYAKVCRNVDYIPINAWGFDEDAMELIKQQKHAQVNKKLSKESLDRLGNKRKHKIARSMGAVPQTVSDVYKFLANSKLADRTPKKPTEQKKNADESNENKDPAPELDPQIAEILKKRGVGKRPVARKATDILNRSKTDELKSENAEEEFRKPKKQHKPLTDADKEKRREIRKQRRKEKSTQAKAAATTPMEIKLDEDAKEADEKPTSDMSFSKMEFVLKDDKPLTKVERRDKLSGRDSASLFKKVQKRQEFVEKIRSKNPEKATSLEQKIKWDTVMKRAEGTKVKDDPKRLEKAVKRKEKAKQIRKHKWDDRVKRVEEDKQKRQDKREANIEKRRSDKVKKKLERARKKGRLV